MLYAVGKVHASIDILREWQQKIFLAYLNELIKLFSKYFYTFFISCFVFETFPPETVKLSAILDLALPHVVLMSSQQG